VRGAAAAGLAAILAAGAPMAAAAPVGLGRADAFAVLAGTGVTNDGDTIVEGDLGTCSTLSVTGFPPGVVNGTIHAADQVACDAKPDLVRAYDATVALPPTTTFGGPTELGGMTLTPGVYNSPTSFNIAGTLTLDAEGDPDAVFAFQAGSTVVTGDDSAVSLLDGAQACNVTWQVGSSATLGDDSDFVGTLLADISISVNGGADVEGRLLAVNGAVTLISDTISRPTCPPPIPTGSLSLGQTPSGGTALVEGTPAALPVTTVTDTRDGTTRSWTVTATASDLVSGADVIPGAEIALAHQDGSFTSGTGTEGALGLVSATDDTVGSVYTYTPTAELAPQGNIAAGSYTGTVTQTVL
jgi:hypothetical protein